MARKQTIQRLIGTVAFVAIGLTLLLGVSAVATPFWSDNMLTDKVRSMNAEPENTIDVLVIGTSNVADGIVPMAMYEDQGVSAFNCGMSKQPAITAVCLAREALRRNPESLRTIVFDPSSLRLEPDPNYYKMTLDGLSIPSKLDVIGEVATDPLDYLGYLFPVFSYHDRWPSYTEEDLNQLSYAAHPFLRGYVPSPNFALMEGFLYNISAHRIQVDPGARGTPLDEDQLAAFERLVDFCRTNGIQLVLAKLPALDWASGEHVAVQRVAESHDLPFLDYNFDPLISEVGYNQALDTRDDWHLNDYGATKVSVSIARYLTANGYAEDRRGDPDYAYLNDYLEDFHAVTSDLTELRQVEDPVEYLARTTSTADDRDWTVYVGATGDALAQLSPEQRQRCADLGYRWLATMDPTQLWLGVVQDGKLVHEDVASSATYKLLYGYDDGTKGLPKEAFFKLENVTLPEDSEDVARSASATIFNKVSWKDATKGVNFVVYDNDLQMVVDVARFRSDIGVRRMGNPQAELDQALAQGAQPWELEFFPWHLYNYERMNEIVRRGVEARAALQAQQAEQAQPVEGAPPVEEAPAIEEAQPVEEAQPDQPVPEGEPASEDAQLP